MDWKHLHELYLLFTINFSNIKIQTDPFHIAVPPNASIQSEERMSSHFQSNPDMKSLNRLTQLEISHENGLCYCFQQNPIIRTCSLPFSDPQIPLWNRPISEFGRVQAESTGKRDEAYRFEKKRWDFRRFSISLFLLSLETQPFEINKKEETHGAARTPCISWHLQLLLGPTPQNATTIIRAKISGFFQLFRVYLEIL